jgi:hypothetical protein
MQDLENVENELREWILKETTLRDIPSHMTWKELDHVIAYEKGKGMKLWIEYYSGDKLGNDMIKEKDERENAFFCHINSPKPIFFL